MENNRNTEYTEEASDGKIYLTQIARYIAEQTGKAQQIIHTAERADITYSAYDEFNKPEETMPMTIVMDADIAVNSGKSQTKPNCQRRR